MDFLDECNDWDLKRHAAEKYLVSLRVDPIPEAEIIDLHSDSTDEVEVKFMRVHEVRGFLGLKKRWKSGPYTRILSRRQLVENMECWLNHDFAKIRERRGALRERGIE